MRKFIFIIIILGIGIGIAGFWFWQKNPYSKEILKLEILGPGTATIGEEVEYTVKYKNNGNIRLEEPRFIFEFPEHSLLAEGSSIRREIGTQEIGDIYPGEEKTFQFKTRLLGKEGEVKTAKAWLNYQPKGLQARYESATTFSTVIQSAPLSFDFDLPSKAEAGREFDFSLNYFSSLDYPLTNLGVQIEYPSDFEFLTSDPKSLGKTEWDIPLLNKAEGGRIDIKGKLSGEVKEQKIFKATLGIWFDGEFVLLKEATKAVEITRPNISVFQQINGQSDYIASPGDLLHYEIYFRNISGDPFVNLFLAATISGSGFDFDTIKTNSGQFTKGDNSIVWDWRDVPKLRFLGQGEEGKVEFWINLKKDWQINSPQEKNIILKDSVLISQIKEDFETKVNSKLEISQTLNPATQTITWQAKNYFNDVKNVKVKAILPQNVRLTGNISPETGKSNFAFDSQSREIVWMVGDMEAGKGVLDEAPKISFQVSSESSQTIINEATISGEDQWTENIIEGKSPVLTF